MDGLRLERIIDGDGDLLSACAAMLNREMDADYTSSTQLLSVMESPRCILLGAFQEDSLVGVIVGKRLTRKESLACMEKRGIDPAKHRGEILGLVTRGAASLSHQGEGVEEMLQREARRMLTTWGCHNVIAF